MRRITIRADAKSDAHIFAERDVDVPGAVVPGPRASCAAAERQRRLREQVTLAGVEVGHSIREAECIAVKISTGMAKPGRGPEPAGGGGPVSSTA